MGTVVSFAVLPALSGPGPGAAIRAACALLHEADAVFSTWDPDTPLSRLRRGETSRTGRAAEPGRRADGLPGGPGRVGRLVRPVGHARRLRPDRAGQGLGRGPGAGRPPPGGPARRPGQRRRGPRGVRRPRPGGTVAGRDPPPVAAGRAGHGDARCTAPSRPPGRYERGAHLVDPHTGRPACRAASATVTGPGLAMADALATALAVGGDAALAAVARLPGYAGYLIRPDGSETWTSGSGGLIRPDRLAGAGAARGRETGPPRPE